MAGPVHVTGDALADIVAHARADAPRECCGLLLGSGDRVESAFRARNALASSSRFQIEPADHFAALRAARASGLDVIGAYHSHPSSSAEPSPRDLDEAAYPGFVHVIVGLGEPSCPDVRAFRLAEGNFQALELVRMG